jgi:hypothetical protein
MADLPLDVAQELNNAIYSLASLNPKNAVASRLNDSWQAWFSTQARSLLPRASWWLALKGYWVAYAAARSGAPNLSERTPPADSINPTIWKTLLSDVQERDALLGDASRATREATLHAIDDVGDAFAKKLSAAARPAIFVSIVIGVALLAAAMRGGGRRT